MAIPTPAPAPARPTARVWRAVRRACTYIAAGGLGLVLAAVIMMLLAFAQGVHCPGCDRIALGSDYPRWVTYFHAKDALLLAGGAFAALGVPIAHQRRYGVAGVLLALVALGFTPR